MRKNKIEERGNIMIGLGDEVKDGITGFRGIVTCISQWLNGCVRCAVQPQKLEKGVPIGEKWIDVAQLEIIKQTKFIPFKQLQMVQPLIRGKTQKEQAPAGPQNDPKF